MVIDEEDSGAEDVDSGAAATRDVAGSAYREGLTSVDGFTRGPNGKVKFNKDTKKRRRQNEDEDVEMEGVEEAQEQGRVKKAKKKAETDFGKEFKAKKAGGDIKKRGVDPYAYLTLAQAAKKKGGKIGVAGKR
jgi:ribosomal RNA-processing protein 12